MAEKLLHDVLPIKDTKVPESVREKIADKLGGTGETSLRGVFNRSGQVEWWAELRHKVVDTEANEVRFYGLLLRISQSHQYPSYRLSAFVLVQEHASWVVYPVSTEELQALQLEMQNG